MNKINAALFVVLSALILSACKKKSPQVKEVKDKDLTMQVRVLENTAGSTSSLDYAIRLIPGKTLDATLDNKTKTALCYGMDSCFYLLADNKKVYSNIVQPIANGVSGSYEYMLSFESTDLKSGKRSLVYQDRYLNHKKYTLSLTEE